VEDKSDKSSNYDLNSSLDSADLGSELLDKMENSQSSLSSLSEIGDIEEASLDNYKSMTAVDKLSTLTKRAQFLKDKFLDMQIKTKDLNKKYPGSSSSVQELFKECESRMESRPAVEEGDSDNTEEFGQTEDSKSTKEGTSKAD